MSTARGDVIVIGSGPNELVCACQLARAGRRVVVLEPRAQPGGIAALQEIVPGFRVEVRPPEHDGIAPSLVAELGLERHGLVLAREQPHPTLVVPRPDGPPLQLFHDVARSRAAIAELSPTDAERWPGFWARMAKLVGFLETLYLRPPPQIMGEGLGELLPLAAVGLRLRRLGKLDMIELLRTLPMSVHDLLEDSFEHELVRAAIAAAGIDEQAQGPRAAGTSFVLLHQLAFRGSLRARTLVRSEQGQLVAVLLRAAAALGVEVRTDTAATIAVAQGRAHGVVLADGSELPANVIVSGADVHRTLLQLVDPSELDPEVVHAVRHVKHRGVRAMMALALDGAPTLREGDTAAQHGTIAIGPSLDHIERAWDDAKHGGISRAPQLLVTVPSLHDPSLAPAGKHVMSVAMQYAPYHLHEGWDDAARDRLADRIVATLAEHFPGLPSLVRGRRLHTPADLERDFGLTEGHMGGGQLGLDQILFMRPLPGFADHRAPLPGLWLCGDACHPGPGLPGLAGAAAAREILQDR